MTSVTSNGKFELHHIVRPGLRAIIFDVDGTLYRQGPLRRAVFYRLLRAHIYHPARLVSTARCLYAYRAAQETLRTSPPVWQDIAEAQLQLASERAGVRPEILLACITRWMEEEPLDLLADFRHEGIKELLREVKQRGLRLGVFSDYPASRKLEAMGIQDHFDVVVTAQDAEVQRFKPNPHGLQVTLHRLGVAAHEALCVGDRADVDGIAALRAGIPCIILGRDKIAGEKLALINIRNYWELLKVLCQGGS